MFVIMFLRKHRTGLANIRDFNIVTCFESPAPCRGRNTTTWLQNEGPMSHWGGGASADCAEVTASRPKIGRRQKRDSVGQKCRTIVTCRDCHQDPPRLPAKPSKTQARKGGVRSTGCKNKRLASWRGCSAGGEEPHPCVMVKGGVPIV